MLAVERRKKIMELLNDSGSVIVTDLSKRMKVTEETIRRDLEKLEKEGKLQRTHGGAYLSGSIMTELPITFREQVYLPGKDTIAFKSVELINSGETIMLDSSTTSLRIAKYIRQTNKSLTVITNALKVANELSDVKSVKLVLTGGSLRNSSLSFVGYAATTSLESYFADKAFVSCSAVHLKKGLMDSNEYEAEIRKLMLRQSERRILVADITKFGKTSFSLIANFNQIDTVIADQKLGDDWYEEFGSLGIEIFDENKK